MPHRSQTNRFTTLQFQLAISIPAAPGNSCTAPVSAACSASPRAGGNLRSARISGPPDRPPRRQRPTGLWCGGPVPVPPPWTMPSSLAPAARRRASVHAPWAWAPESSAGANPWHPSAIVQDAEPSPSHPSPTPLQTRDKSSQCPTNLPHPSAHFTLALV